MCDTKPAWLKWITIHKQKANLEIQYTYNIAAKPLLSNHHWYLKRISEKVERILHIHRGKKVWSLAFFFQSGHFLNFSNFSPQSQTSESLQLNTLAACCLALHSWLSKLLTHLCLQALYQPASQSTGRLTSQLC